MFNRMKEFPPTQHMPVAPEQGASAFRVVWLQRLGARGHKPIRQEG